MKHADLQEGRLYLVDHPRGKYPPVPGRLIRRASSGGYHTIAFPEDPDAEVRVYSVEVGVKSRDIEREWTEADDRAKVEREEERARIAELQSHLDAWFAGCEPEHPFSAPAEIRNGRLFVNGEAIDKVLAALEAVYGKPWVKALPVGAPSLPRGEE